MWRLRTLMKVNSPTWTSLDPVKPGIEQGPLNCEQTCSVFTRSHCRLRVKMSKKYLKILEGDENVGSVKPKYKKVKNYLAQVQFFQTPKKLEYLKKWHFYLYKLRYPGPFNCIKIFFYIIYSGNIISCSKRELTEYWNDERIPLSILLIVFLICRRVGQMRSRSRHSAVVGASQF